MTPALCEFDGCRMIAQKSCSYKVNSCFKAAYGEGCGKKYCNDHKHVKQENAYDEVRTRDGFERREVVGATYECCLDCKKKMLDEIDAYTMESGCLGCFCFLILAGIGYMIYALISYS